MRICTSLLLLSSFLLTSCLESPSMESDSSGKEESKNSSEASAGVPEKEEEMSFPEALKIKRSLGRELDSLKRDFEKKDKIAAEELEAMERLEPVRAYRGKLEETHAELTRSLAFWKQATRDSFKGVKLPTLVTVSGDSYESIEIVEVTDHQLKVTHSGGSATLEISDLPVGLRKNLIHESTVIAELANQ